MDQTIPKVRVVNFSSIQLAGEHLLNFGSEDIASIVNTIRRHADLPCVFVLEKENLRKPIEVRSALKAIRSPCYPYAVFLINGAELDVDASDVEIVKIDSADPKAVRDRIDEYVRTRFSFNTDKLRIDNSRPLPAKIDVAIVGAGITGLYAANRLKEAGIGFCVVEKSNRVGGIWSVYANRTSRVNSSECAYRLLEKKTRSNRDHSDTWEILEDIFQLAQRVSSDLFLETEVEAIEAVGNGYRILLNRGGQRLTVESQGVILAINDRVGAPREVRWENQSAFKGNMVAGISNYADGLDWRDKKVVVIGMGAFAVENVRTALEGGARHVTVVCRRHGTICPKIIDYLNFTTPYDDAFKHDKKSNLMNMMYWKKTYELSGATQPECWMSKIKHPGHTISVSDIWFVGHYLKKIETVVGQISAMTENGVLVDGQRLIEADIIVNAIGFERNTHAAQRLSGCRDMYTHNYISNDFMYLADAEIDDDAFNSVFGSSVLEMVKFFIEVFIQFFNNPEYDAMAAMEGIERIPIADRKWSHYIRSAMALMRAYPKIREIAQNQVAQRTQNFLEVHDLETYIAANKREWIDTHSMLAGRLMKEEECLPYVFEKLLRK